MSREKQIEETFEEDRLTCPYCDYKFDDEDIQYANEMVYKNGYAKGYADAKAEWISVKKQMPEEVYGKYRKRISVLVCTKSGKVSVASRQRAVHFDKDKLVWVELDTFEWNGRKIVTHWMPLPNPPKGE